MMKSKKGISPIHATLLLIIIAVAAISVTYAWVMTYQGSGSTTDPDGAILYIENIRFLVSDKIEITMGNSGIGDTRLASLHMGTSSESMSEVSSSSSGLGSSGQLLDAGAVTAFNVTTTWTQGQTYYFRVVPNPGQYCEFQAKAP